MPQDNENTLIDIFINRLKITRPNLFKDIDPAMLKDLDASKLKVINPSLYEAINTAWSRACALKNSEQVQNTEPKSETQPEQHESIESATDNNTVPKFKVGDDNSHSQRFMTTHTVEPTPGTENILSAYERLAELRKHLDELKGAAEHVSHFSYNESQGEGAESIIPDTPGEAVIPKPKKPSLPPPKERKHILIALGITLAVILLVFFFNNLYSLFHTSAELKTNKDGSENLFVTELIYYRKALFNHDIWRSTALIVTAAAFMLLYVYRKINKGWLIACLCGLIFFDLWSVDKRYFDDSKFSKQSDYSSQFEMQPWEKYILDKDKSPSYRVANLLDDQKWAARTSFRLKSVFGYSAAKLRRYDDILNQHLYKGHAEVYNMLNTKYVITKDKEKDSIIVVDNPAAMGNAWFVDTIRLANTPQEESDGLMKYDLHRNAIVGKDCASHVKNMTPGADSLTTITMTKYEPDAVYYDVKCSKPGTIVFSEIYYPYGWQAYVDDKPVDHYRVNYVLRALNIQPGSHKIRFEFRPESVEKGDYISMFFVIIMYITLAVCPIWWIVKQVVKYRKRRNESK